MSVKINVNHRVRIKLTDHGRSVVNRDVLLFHPENKDGYSEWLLWELMETFGSHLYLGCRMPFEADIWL